MAYAKKRFVFRKLKLKKRLQKKLKRPAKYLTRRRIAAAINLLALLALVFAIGVSAGEYSLNKRLAKQAVTITHQANQPGIPSSNAIPSTVKQAAESIDTYRVAPDMPRYLLIPRLGVKARVLSVGLTIDGAVGTPANVYNVAWYSGSAKPGQAGAALVDGHVSSWTTHGVFYNLSKLQPGDSLTIELGDGTQLAYRVVKSVTYNADNVDMAAALSPIDPSAPGLNLITCSGTVLPGTSEFNQRIVIFATQI